MALADQIRSLLASQQLAVLATQNQGQPYTSLLALVASPDLRRVAFATLRETQKFAHLTAGPEVALLVDDRCMGLSDLSQRTALTILGLASEAHGDERGELRQLYLAKHPQLKSFVDRPECALVQVTVRRYVLVREFTEKYELKLTPEP